MNVSHIITTYNQPDELHLVLKTVAGQRRLPDEVLVADDGSTASTAAVIRLMQASMKCPVHHVWQEDHGFRKSSILNKAILRSRGDYLVFSDGDSLLHRGFVKDHVERSRMGAFCHGHRVMLSAARTRQVLQAGEYTFSFLDRRLHNRINGLYSRGLSRLMTFDQRNGPGRAKGANLSCWRSDAILVNGYDESFTGWGLEDTDFCTRLMNAGIARRDIRFGAIQYHLDHGKHNKSRDRELLKANETRLLECSSGNRVSAVKGLDAHSQA